MKVYYKIDNIDYNPDELTPGFKSIEEKYLYLMLEKMKFQIMWELRSLENEINESKGFIIIELDNRRPQFNATAHDFDEDLFYRINRLVSKIKFT